MSDYRRPTPQGTQPLSTERLTLRKFKEYDAAAMYEWSNDEDILKYFTIRPPEDENQARTMIGSWRMQYAQDDFLKWCIAEAETNLAIGEISASIEDATSTAEVEYMLSPLARGKGYMPEALRAVIRFLHEECGIHRVIAEVNAHNNASMRTTEKAGMALEGIFTDALVDRHGQFYDVGVFVHVEDAGSD